MLASFMARIRTIGAADGVFIGSKHTAERLAEVCVHSLGEREPWQVRLS